MGGGRSKEMRSTHDQETNGSSPTKAVGSKGAPINGRPPLQTMGSRGALVGQEVKMLGSTGDSYEMRKLRQHLEELESNLTFKKKRNIELKAKISKMQMKLGEEAMGRSPSSSHDGFKSSFEVDGQIVRTQSMGLAFERKQLDKRSKEVERQIEESIAETNSLMTEFKRLEMLCAEIKEDGLPGLNTLES